MPFLLHGVTNATTTAKASTTLDTDIIEGHIGEMCEVQEGTLLKDIMCEVQEETLLKDIMVKCVRCKRDVRAGDYDTHECSTLTYQSGGEDGIMGPEKTGFH